LDDSVLLNVQNFVNFSTDNNIRLAQYDRQLHYTTVMMQRHRSSDIPKSLPVFVKDVPVKNEHSFATGQADAQNGIREEVGGYPRPRHSHRHSHERIAEVNICMTAFV
jgi:hypothetical protein